MIPDVLGVIGLGAIGGSIAARAVRAGVPHVLGYAASTRDRSMAARAGAVTDLTTSAEQVAARADLVVLAVPPRACLDLLARLASLIRERDALCTDVAGVKAPLAHSATALGLRHHYAGSHPLAGSHQTGFAAASPARFERVTVYVTELEGGERAATEVADFWTRVCGAEPVRIDPRRHDEILAWTSHLPQAVASALAHAFARSGPKGVTLGPGGREATRIVAGGAEMWADILQLNREAVLARLDDVEVSVSLLREALVADDGDALKAWLQTAADWRTAVEQ